MPVRIVWHLVSMMAMRSNVQTPVHRTKHAEAQAVSEILAGMQERFKTKRIFR